ncbi:MAG: hypothetical protein FJ095_04060 [Deltaproteobacteria bacterium]|nr:hypothetical protein [Deltaproteobacteria bacterium]
MNTIDTTFLRGIAVVALTLGLTACTGDASPPTSSSSGSSGGGTELEDPQKDCPEGDICMKPPAEGFQVSTLGDEIAPGQDVEYCEVVELPGTKDDVYHVDQFEVAMTAHSHHLIVVAAIPGSATEAAMTVGDKKKCFTPDVYGGEIMAVTGSQLPYHSEGYPAGVGKVFHGGQKLVFDYHYYNSSSKPVTARGAVNFHVTKPEDVTRIAHSFGFYNFDIKTPPQTTKSFEAECSFSHDVMVHKVTRHTHQWGRDFSVAYAGGAKDGEHIWTSPHYEETDHVFVEPVLMPKGTGFRFSCEFENDTAKTLKFGVTAADEMCILFGTWFSPVEGAVEEEQGCRLY